MQAAFVKASPLLQTLQKAGYEAYFVGGAVRDTLLGRAIGDLDIATSAPPEAVVSIFEKTIPVGIEHGTVMVGLDGEFYEVTTYRREGKYEDYRHPSEVEFITSLEEDLSRRDFTINAIAMDLNGRVIDPFAGQADLRAGVLRTVGNPSERFREDPLRMMRAARFVSQLGFQIHKDTKTAMVELHSFLENIAVERTIVEFEKLLSGKSYPQAFQLLIDTEIIEVLPGLKAQQEQLSKCAKLPFTKLVTVEEHWTLLLIGLNIAEARGFLKKWKASNRKIKSVQLLLSAVDESKQAGVSKLLFYQLGKDNLAKLARLHASLENKSVDKLTMDYQQQYQELPIHSRSELVMNGNDLLKWTDRQAGPWISDSITAIERAIVEGKLSNHKQQIKEWFITCLHQSDSGC